MRLKFPRGAVGAGLLIATFLMAGPAAADPERLWRAACTSDALVHCPVPALSGDRDRVADCMIHKLDKLSNGCRAVINAALAENDPAPVRANLSGRPQRALAVR